MISVLTHVDLATVETYLRESARVLKPSGRLVTTAFLLDDQVDSLLAAGKGSFRMAAPYGPSRVENRSNPELAIAHPRKTVLDIVQRAGFAQSDVATGSWSGRPASVPMDFQDLLIADCNPGAALPLVTQPALSPDPATAVQQGVYDKIGTLTCGDDRYLADFITWSAASAMNAFWWHSDGWTLTLPQGGPSVRDQWAVTFAAFRELQLGQNRPDGMMGGGQFHALDDAAMMNILIRTRRVIGRHSLHNILFEAAQNGLHLHETMRTGKVPVLAAPGRAPLHVKIPEFLGCGDRSGF